MFRLPFALLASIIVTPGLVALVTLITDWKRPLQADASLQLIANLLLVSLTACYVVLTYSLLKTQTDPCVVLYPKREGTLVYLVVENIGKGLARNIEFKISEPMKVVPAASALTSGAALMDMEQGPLVQGIPALAPGQKRLMLWGPIHVLSKWLGDRTITATCSFSDDRQPAKPIECPLELHSLRFTGEEYTDGGRDLSDMLAELVRRNSLVR